MNMKGNVLAAARSNVFVAILVVFGGISAYNVIRGFGGQAVDLPPLAFFLYSLWVAFRNFTGYTLVFVALPLLVGRAARCVLVPISLGIIVVECASAYARSAFHADLSTVWLDLAENTSVKEVVGLIRMTCSPVNTVLFLLFLVLLVAISVWLWQSSYPKISFRSVTLGLLLLLPFALFNVVFMNWHFGVSQMGYTSFVVSTVQSWRNMRGVTRACTHPNLPEKVSTSVPFENLPDIVFVIGESSTRNNWHLYGYRRTTTPRMDDICREGSGVCYSDVVGTQPDTVNALSLFLTDVEFDKRQIGSWTLAEVFRRAGYRCVLVSSPSEGSASSMMYRLFNGCEKRIDLRNECSGTFFDESVVPFVRRELSADESRPTVLFVHLNGMHFPVQNIVPEKDSIFNDHVEGECLSDLSENAKDRRNRYDNGILYEDKVLGAIVDVLSQTSRASCMFFCSDHGETPRSFIWRDYEDRDLYEIPVVFWFSTAYKKRFPKTVAAVMSARHKALQQDQMTHGLLTLGQINFWEQNMQSRNYLSPLFIGRNPRVMNKGRQVYSGGNPLR